MPFDTASYRNLEAPPARHSRMSFPGGMVWEWEWEWVWGMGMDGMAYSGQLLVANIYLLGPLASRMCRSSV